MEIVYVLELTGLSGGIKNVLEHVNRLHDHGYKVQLFALDGQPAWFPLKVNVRTFPNYLSMLQQLKSMDAIKVATWWKTLRVVLNSCDPSLGGRGVPFYLVQDIEESYYPGDQNMQEKVRQTYKTPAYLLTIADWTTRQLAERFQKEASNISIAVDLDMFRPNRTADYDRYRILACSRKSQHLKGFDITLDGIKKAKRIVPQASFVTFGIEKPNLRWIPHLHFQFPNDSTISYLYGNCGVFVQTSYHEGFGLPILEAMACGAPVVTTKAEGNEEFCQNNWNCVLVEKGDVNGVATGLVRILTDPEFASFISENAKETAQRYNWPRVIDKLATVYRQFG